MNTNGADFIISKARAVPFAAIGAAIEQTCATRLALPGGAVLMLTEIGDPASRNNLTTTKRTLQRTISASRNRSAGARQIPPARRGAP